MVPSVLVVLAHGFEEVEAIVPIDLIRRSGAKVTVAGLDDLTIRGAHNISVACDVGMEECRERSYDCIILPGGSQGSKNLAASALVMTKIIEVAHAGDAGVGRARVVRAASAASTPGLLSDSRGSGVAGGRPHHHPERQRSNRLRDRRMDGGHAAVRLDEHTESMGGVSRRPYVYQPGGIRIRIGGGLMATRRRSASVTVSLINSMQRYARRRPCPSFV